MSLRKTLSKIYESSLLKKSNVVKAATRMEGKHLISECTKCTKLVLA